MTDWIIIPCCLRNYSRPWCAQGPSLYHLKCLCTNVVLILMYTQTLCQPFQLTSLIISLIILYLLQIHNLPLICCKIWKKKYYFWFILFIKWYLIYNVLYSATGPCLLGTTIHATAYKLFKKLSIPGYFHCSQLFLYVIS